MRLARLPRRHRGSRRRHEFAAADAAGLLKPKAYVVLRTGGDGIPGRSIHEERKVHVKRAVGPWKYPRWIEFVDALPRTANGKLQRQLLRARPG